MTAGQPGAAGGPIGGRTLARWWDQLLPLRPRALWAGHLDLTFQPGTNLYAARQMVPERMTQAHALPNVGSPPIMIQPLASVGQRQGITTKWKTSGQLTGELPSIVLMYGPTVLGDPARVKIVHTPRRF